jgi:hypothetical protein
VRFADQALCPAVLYRQQRVDGITVDGCDDCAVLGAESSRSGHPQLQRPLIDGRDVLQEAVSFLVLTCLSVDRLR